MKLEREIAEMEASLENTRLRVAGDEFEHGSLGRRALRVGASRYIKLIVTTRCIIHKVVC